MPSDPDQGDPRPAEWKPPAWGGVGKTRGMLSRSRMVVAAAALAAFVGFSWYAYDQATRPGGEAVAPLIRADAGPTRVRPDQPGGMEVPHQDKLIYEQLALQRLETEEGRLLPPPETPMPRPDRAGEPAPEAGPATGAAKVEILIGPVPPPKPPIAVDEAPPAPAAGTVESALAPAAGPGPAPGEPGATAPASAPGPAPAPGSEAAKAAETVKALKPSARAGPEPSALPAGPGTTPAKTPEKTPEKMADETEVAAVSAADVAPSSAGRYRVQVAALRNRDAAEGEWARLSKANADLLGPLTLTVEEADLGPKGVFFRVQGGPLEKQAAADLCAELKRRKAGCFVVKR